jgi:glyoxylase-like metal-dependent hydrolase (beta-lactamase superfamily II)
MKDRVASHEDLASLEALSGRTMMQRAQTSSMKNRVASVENLSSLEALSGRTAQRGVQTSSLRDSLNRTSSQWLPGLSLDDGALPDHFTSPKATAGSRRSISAGFGSSLQQQQRRSQSRIFDDSAVTAGYASVPLLDMQALPRGGMSIETKAVGRVQLGIPPETIKDSMQMGLEVPRVYIVPVERFCREMSPALGINLAEFEFPAYFNFFVRGKKCVLVVDSDEAEENIRSVFEETLLGPKQFRGVSPISHEPEDFDPSYPKESRPDFSKEFRHFRVSEKTDVHTELSTDMLLEFCHFRDTVPEKLGGEEMDSAIGVPPIPPESEEDLLIKFNASSPAFHRSSMVRDRCANRASRFLRESGSLLVEPDDNGPATDEMMEPDDNCKAKDSRRGSLESRQDSMFSDTSQFFADDKPRASWLFSRVRWLGAVATVWPMNATAEQIKNRSVPRAEIFKMPGSTEYIIHDVDENNVIVGKALFSGAVQVPDEIGVEGFLDPDAWTVASLPGSLHDVKPDTVPFIFHPPSFGVTVLGNSHGFDKNGSTSGYVLWINGRGVMIDPPPYSSATLEREGIRPQMIIGVIITHCHADHDAGAFQKVLTGSRVSVITTPTIYKSFIRKYAALSGLSPTLLRHSHRYRAAIIGQPLRFQGATFHFFYSLHTIPCIGFRVEWRGRSMVFSGDHLNLPPLIDDLEKSVSKVF